MATERQPTEPMIETPPVVEMPDEKYVPQVPAEKIMGTSSNGGLLKFHVDHGRLRRRRNDLGRWEYCVSDLKAIAVERKRRGTFPKRGPGRPRKVAAARKAARPAAGRALSRPDANQPVDVLRINAALHHEHTQSLRARVVDFAQTMADSVPFLHEVRLNISTMKVELERRHVETIDLYGGAKK